MAIDRIPYDPADDEYIDMDISSTFCYSITSPPQPNREFEFHMSSNTHETDSATSPADELFYNGKLLPLHLPPRLKMVQNLPQNTNSRTHEPLKTQSFEQKSSTNNTTPFESCNISPSDSCQVSRELNPDEYFYESATDNAGFIDDHRKKSWSKKLKLIKHSSLGVKLKASRAYLKSLFNKSGCSDEKTCAAVVRNGDEHTVSKEKECLNKSTKVAKKNPFGNIPKERCQVEAAVARGIVAEKVTKDGSDHRRSFSGVLKWYSEVKSSSSLSSNSSSSSSSSSSSVNSNKYYGLQLLKRSSSANSEVERSIQGAIAHCKQSQQLFSVRKSVNEVGFCSLSASRISACEKQELQGMCRG